MMNSLSILLYKLFPLTITIIVVFIRANSANCQPSDGSFPGHGDLVQSLPNVSLPPNTDYLSVGHYSGNLNISIGKASMYYWFFRAQTGNWQAQPVMLHLGGYVSTLNGALTGISPLRMQENGTLRLNEYAWNKRANLLFLDSSNLVTFRANSYSYKMRNDTIAVKFTYEIIEKFYQKFPFLSQNEFFISGLGYESMHIAILAKHLVVKRFPPNFKGVLLGNGVYNTSEAVNSHFEYVYRLKRDLYEQTFWTNLTTSCCPHKSCSYWSKANDPCTFRQCQSYTFEDIKPSKKLESDCHKFYYTFYKYISRNYVRHQKSQDLHNVHEKCVPGPTCSRYIITQKITDWLNSVKEELHVNKSTRGFVAGDRNPLCETKSQYPTLHGHLMFLLRSNIRVLLYTGDSDGVVSPYNTEWLLNDLSLQPMHQNQAWEFEGNTAGFRIRYCGGLSYYGIMGAGHSVAEDKPGPLSGMVNEFIFGDLSANSLSPWDGHCPQTVPDCGKFCSTDPLPAKPDYYCHFWIESMYRYFVIYL